MRPVEIILDKPRQIKLTWLAMSRAEKARGLGWMAMLSPSNVGADSLLCLLWAGLLIDDPTLTITELDKIIQDTFEKDPAITKKIDEAIAEALDTQGWRPEKVADTKNS